MSEQSLLGKVHNLLELFQFQRAAAAELADRYISYSGSPVVRGRGANLRQIPFYQALSSITGSGKTAILAQAVSEIVDMSELAPIVLWISKGKVVVSQSFANLEVGGKYNHLLGNAAVNLLSEYRIEDVEQTSEAMVYFATVGTFNQRDKESGSLKIFQSEMDTTETSTWEALKSRQTSDGRKRPLIVVYDEAQNLSDLQTDLLLDLQPTGFLLASATLRFPDRFNTEVISPLRSEDFTDSDLITIVPSSVVVQSGLVKGTISLQGLNSPMQETVTEMLRDMREAESDAEAEGLSLRPKAIYVCNTNVVEDDAARSDDPRQPFNQRQAPPIAIWRHLTEACEIPASEIAVYADLKTHRDYPLPDGFNLFSGGERDYEKFVDGDFRHIIFNLALQEGWDDPESYFAYIDKSMDSRVQITQVVGRVLRQPGAAHYAAPRLNTAHFYVRVDRNNVFNEVVEEVRKGLGGEAPEVRIITTPPGKEKPVELSARIELSVSRTAILNDTAEDAVATAMSKLSDYSGDTVNTKATGRRRSFVQEIGTGNAVEGEWSEFEHSSGVSARWVFRREVSRRYRPAIAVMHTDGSKFDATVGVGSPAYGHVVTVAADAVQEYLENAEIKQVKPNPYVIGGALVRRSGLETFTNSVHEGYDGLNTTLELPFARALDELGLPWTRNPSQTGYKIPLISLGPTAWFFPDFLLWVGSTVLCLDTKGEFLVQTDAGRKLLSIIPNERAESRIAVKLISKGKWKSDGTPGSKDGFSLWGLRQDQRLKVEHFDDLESLVSSFKAFSQVPV